MRAVYAVAGARRAAMVVWPELREHDAYVYGIRLLAFLALIVGIVDKNRTGGAG